MNQWSDLCCGGVATWFPLILSPYEVSFGDEMLLGLSSSASFSSHVTRLTRHFHPSREALEVWVGLQRMCSEDFRPFGIALPWGMIAIRSAYDQLHFLDLPHLFASFGHEFCLLACAWSFSVTHLGP